MKWISVKDSMPYPHQMVLVTNGLFTSVAHTRIKNKEVREFEWDNRCPCASEVKFPLIPTHCMYMPELPK